MRNILWIPYLVFLAITMAGVYFSSKSWRKWWIIYSLILSTNLVAMIFSGGTRYSIPMAPALVLLFALGVIGILLLFFSKTLIEDQDVQ